MDSLGMAAQPPTRCSTKCVPVLAAYETPLLDEASEPQRRPWEDLPEDIIGVVVRRLPLLEDRARLRSVCHAWRAAARLHRRLLPPPLPLLVLSDFAFSSLRAAEGTTMTGWRRRFPLPETETTAAVSVSAGSGSGSVVRCVGSFDGWLVGVERDQCRELGDLRCFLTNPFSHGVVRLPPPSAAAAAAAHPGDDDEFIRSLPIANGSGVVLNCATSTAQSSSAMSFCKVILSSSPDTGTDDCVVAAMSMAKSANKLALWRSGMESWCVCYGSCVGKFFDVIFCQGKLYMFNCGELSADLFFLELSEDDDGTGLIVSRVERRVMEVPEVTDGYQQDWSIVEWRGKVLIVAAYTGDADVWQRIIEVRVFEVDLGTDPVRLTEIKSLDGDCIFISPCSSKSFRSSQDDDGVGGDRVYFIDGYLFPDKNARPFYKFVYSMEDGTVASFPADIPHDKLRAPDGVLLNPTWLFPPE